MLSPTFSVIKDNLPKPAPTRLSTFTLLAIKGADAETFAQAQFMNDVRSLEPMHWQWSGWLNAKGRVIALFALLRINPGQLLLVLPDYAASDLAIALKRFVFRSKVTLTPLETMVAAVDHATSALPESSIASAIVGDPNNGWCMSWGSPAEPRYLSVVPTDQAAAATAEGDARWLDFDMRHGLPRLGRDQVAAWTPHMLSLDRLAAFSLKKGCYPGQEIVARTHFLGQSKRKLSGLTGSHLQTGQILNAEGHEVGVIISASPDGLRALAVMAAISDTDALHTEAGPCELLPILDGLGRGRP